MSNMYLVSTLVCVTEAVMSRICDRGLVSGTDHWLLIPSPSLLNQPGHTARHPGPGWRKMLLDSDTGKMLLDCETGPGTWPGCAGRSGLRLPARDIGRCHIGDPGAGTMARALMWTWRGHASHVMRRYQRTMGEERDFNKKLIFLSLREHDY